jgi:hypothetical protein
VADQKMIILKIETYSRKLRSGIPITISWIKEEYARQEDLEFIMKGFLAIQKYSSDDLKEN